MAYKVFISHSSTDSWVAEQIDKYLCSAGAETYLDRHKLRYGDEFNAVLLRQEIPNCDELVVLMTPWALKSDYVTMEIAAAYSHGLKIVAVLYGVSVEEIKNPVLRNTHLVPINDIDNYFDQVKSLIANS